MNKMKVCFLIFFLSIFLLAKEVEAGVANRSEIRAIFVHSSSLINPDWDLITQNLIDSGIDILIIETFGNNCAHFSSDIVQFCGGSPPDNLAPAIAAAHARGIEVHISMNVLLNGPGYWYPPLEEDWKVVNSTGHKYEWLDPCHPGARAHLKALVEEVATNYDIDGLMFDYARYLTADMSYSQACRQLFGDWLNETIPDSNWPPTAGGGGDFRPPIYDSSGNLIDIGPRYNEFAEWRTHPINDLVGDIRNWMLAIKSDLELSAAVWGWEPGFPTYNCYWYGQDAAYWVKEGWLDWVAPMQYTTDVDRVGYYFDAMVKEMVGGPEGKMPLVAFLSTLDPATDYTVPIDPPIVKAEVDTVRDIGADGWAFWRYGGPGDGEDSVAPDIRDYLNLIDMPDVFSIKDVDASPGGTITWNTDKLATSKVEYSTSPLFTATFVLEPYFNFHYWNISHVPGNIVEDTNNVTFHSITLTGLQEGMIYYYRVQSQDDSGIATSKVYAFEAGLGPVTTTTTTSTTTTIPVGQVLISGQLRNATGSIQANITVYNQGTDQVNASDTTTNGNYTLAVWPDVYDIQYGILNFFIPNFWIKLFSLSITSNLQNVVNYVTGHPTTNKVSFTIDITNDQTIHVYSPELPSRVTVNGTEIQDVSSLSQLQRNRWYYNDSEKKLYMIGSPVLPTTTTTSTTTTISGTTTTSTTTTTIPGAEKTFGNTNVGASSYGWSENKILGSRYIAPENGIITKISWRTSSEGASGNAKAAVYSDSSGAPNTLLGNSTESTITSSSWVDFTFPNPVTITAGNAYWLIVWQQYSVWYRYDTGSPNQFVLKTATYGTDWPTLFGAADGFDNHNMSIYATYTPS